MLPRVVLKKSTSCSSSLGEKRALGSATRAPDQLRHWVGGGGLRLACTNGAAWPKATANALLVRNRRRDAPADLRPDLVMGVLMVLLTG